ncbi:helix-turn-helix domain-containing protein [Nonomuraea glycinis]|uniref:helix-turn-helix domain-containing protein n=1 Tax=Nonomuraea glycinis TaxID=2047744 RepID=UPI002E11E7E5|nr:helix-turn-helix transcriptional regulator [Nonomuraea glycinis]
MRASTPRLRLRLRLGLGQLVYDRRVALGLSQTELAERAGMTQSQVSRLETAGGNTPGDNPPITPHTARTGADRVNGMGQRSPSGWGDARNGLQAGTLYPFGRAKPGDQAYSRCIPRCYRRVQRSLQWGLAAWRAFLWAVKSWLFSGPEAEDLLGVGMPSLVSRAWWGRWPAQTWSRSRLPPTRRYVIHGPRETSHFLKHVLRTGGVATVGRVSMKGSSCFVLFGVLPW